MTSPARSETAVPLWAFVLDADRFVRLHFLFFSGLWPILGAMSVKPDLSATDLAVLLAATICFHLYAFVLNDVIDLPVDRTQPRRMSDPLVRGAITMPQAVVLVSLQPVVAAMVTWWAGGGVQASSVLAVAFVSMGAYNLWGKRCPVPPLTDLIQGIAWGALPIYGALIVGSAPNVASWLVAAYGVGYTLFMNGIHGGLRDLENDLKKGARTTAIYLGARPGKDGGDPIVPARVTAFTSVALAGLIATNVALVATNPFGFPPRVLWLVGIVSLALNGASLLLMPLVFRPAGAAWEMAFRLQMYLVLMALPAAFVAAANPLTLVVLLTLKVISLVVLDTVPAIFDWTMTRMLVFRRS